MTVATMARFTRESATSTGTTVSVATGFSGREVMPMSTVAVDTQPLKVSSPRPASVIAPVILAVAAASKNGFPVDPDVVNRGINFLEWLARFRPEMAGVVAANLGPSGSLECLISLPRATVEVTVEPGESGFDVFLVSTAVGAEGRERHCENLREVASAIEPAAAA